MSKTDLELRRNFLLHFFHRSKLCDFELEEPRTSTSRLTALALDSFLHSRKGWSILEPEGRLGIKTVRIKIPKDYEARLELCKMIGLDDVPRNNPKAIDEIAGMLGKELRQKRVNAVEVVRSIRG